MITVLVSTISYGDLIDDIIPHVIMVESSGNPHAMSKAGAVGLMQIMPIVLKEFNKEIQWEQEYFSEDKGRIAFKKQYKQSFLKIPYINLEVGEWYLRRLKDHYLKDVKAKPFRWVYYDGYRYIESEPDWKLALLLSAYHGGVTRLRNTKYNLSKMPQSTKNYVNKVMKAYKEAQ